MRNIRLAIVAGLTLGGSVAAGAATAQDAFLGTFKKFGITPEFANSKKPCLCTGGSFNQRAGRFVISKAGNSWRFDCSIPTFAADGTATGGGLCIGNGGTVTVIDK
jgi:hypothetical protein